MPKLVATPENIGGFTDTSQLVEVRLDDTTTVQAAIIDPLLAGRLEAPGDDPFLTAVQIVADLLVLRREIVVNDLGGGIQHHGLVLARSDAGVIDADLLAPLTALLLTTDGLRVAETVDLGSIADSFVYDGAPLRITLPERPVVDLTERFDRINELRPEAIATVSMLPEDDPNQAVWAKVIDALPSTAYTDEQVEELIAGLRDEFSVYLEGVVGPSPFSFTLTGESRPIRFQITNLTTTTLTVRVRMSSAKLSFPESERLVELAPLDDTEVDMRAELITNGTSSVFLDILTPSTDTPVVPRITLTGSAYALTGLGQLITGAGLLVVCTWWVRNVRRSRRKRLASGVLPRHPSTNGAGTNGAATNASTSGAGADGGPIEGTGSLSPS